LLDSTAQLHGKADTHVYFRYPRRPNPSAVFPLPSLLRSSA
jgi:hypothetical protein